MSGSSLKACMMGKLGGARVPNRRSTPSSRSSDRKADRPVMRFPPVAAALLVVPGFMQVLRE